MEFRARGVAWSWRNTRHHVPQEGREHVRLRRHGEPRASGRRAGRRKRGQLKSNYAGTHVDLADFPRPGMTAENRATLSGFNPRPLAVAPLDCQFCSVSAFNGRQYRHRPIEKRDPEMRSIKEKWMLVVTTNLIERAPGAPGAGQGAFPREYPGRLGKKLDRPGHDQHGRRRELLSLAAEAGCQGVSSVSSPRLRPGWRRSERSSPAQGAQFQEVRLADFIGTTFWSSVSFIIGTGLG